MKQGQQIWWGDERLEERYSLIPESRSPAALVCSWPNCPLTTDMTESMFLRVVVMGVTGIFKSEVYWMSLGMCSHMSLSILMTGLV